MSGQAGHSRVEHSLPVWWTELCDLELRVWVMCSQQSEGSMQSGADSGRLDLSVGTVNLLATGVRKLLL